MTYGETIILGIIQGLTEFLPVSSSGHLVITEHILGLSQPGVSLEIWLHLGTLVAVLVYFAPKIWELIAGIFGPQPSEMRRLLLALIIGTIPAVIVGLGFKDIIEEAFKSPYLAAIMLTVTGMFLLVSIRARNKDRNIGAKNGFLIGIAQAFAILPGISRSGSTIVTGMFLGVNPSLAAEFSFLLAIPAIGGAFLLDSLERGSELFLGDAIQYYVAGAVVSFVFGIASIHFLLSLIRRGKLYYFGVYCMAVGITALLFLK